MPEEVIKKLTDSIFGPISYHVLWRRDYQVPFLRKEREVVLVIAGDDDADFEPRQQLQDGPALAGIR